MRFLLFFHSTYPLSTSSTLRVCCMSFVFPFSASQLTLFCLLPISALCFFLSPRSCFFTSFPVVYKRITSSPFPPCVDRPVVQGFFPGCHGRACVLDMRTFFSTNTQWNCVLLFNDKTLPLCFSRRGRSPPARRCLSFLA